MAIKKEDSNIHPSQVKLDWNHPLLIEQAYLYVCEVIDLIGEKRLGIKRKQRWEDQDPKTDWLCGPNLKAILYHAHMMACNVNALSEEMKRKGH